MWRVAGAAGLDGAPLRPAGPARDAAQARGLRPGRRHPERRADRAGRLGRLAVLAPVRLRRLLRGPPRRRRPTGGGGSRRRARSARPGAATAPGRSCSRRSSRPPTAPSASSTSCRPRDGEPRPRPHRRGAAGPRAAALELAPRFGYGARRPGCAAHGRAPLAERRARHASSSTRPVPVRRGRRGHLAELRGRSGRAGPVRAHLAPVARAGAPPPVEPERALATTEAFWRRGRRRSPGRRRAGASRWSRSLVTLKALTYSRHRRHRRRADHVAARAARRRAQLGLPLLLAPRRDLHAARAHGRRLRRRGARLARLAAARGRGRPGRPADHVRPRRRAAAHRARARPGSRATSSRAPVRIGNAASGSSSSTCTARCSTALHHAAAQRARRATRTPGRVQRALLDWLEGHWEEPDEGIWEVRGPRQRLHALEGDGLGGGRPRRCAAIDGSGLDGPVDRWRALRDDIHADVCTRGYDPARGTFTQAYGSKRARRERSSMIPLVGFLPAHRPARARHHRGDRAGADGGRARAPLRQLGTAASTGCRRARACSSPAPSGSPTRSRLLGRRDEATRTVRARARASPTTWASSPSSTTSARAGWSGTSRRPSRTCRSCDSALALSAGDGGAAARPAAPTARADAARGVARLEPRPGGSAPDGGDVAPAGSAR